MTLEETRKELLDAGYAEALVEEVYEQLRV